MRGYTNWKMVLKASMLRWVGTYDIIVFFHGFCGNELFVFDQKIIGIDEGVELS